MAISARQSHLQHVHYLRKSVTYSDAGSTVTVGKIPSGALILKPISGIAVTTTFDGTTTFDLGISTDRDKFATDMVLTSATFVPIDVAIDNSVAADTEIACSLTTAGTATQGAAEVIVAYIPDNDG